MEEKIAEANIRRRLRRTDLAFMTSVWILIIFCTTLSFLFFSCHFITMPVLYIFMMYFSYTWHWLVHQKLLRPLWLTHMHHHVVEYPCRRFLSRHSHEGISDWVNFIVHDGLIILVLASFIIVWSFSQFGQAVDIFFGSTMYLIIFTYAKWLHQAFHIDGHWMEQYAWFHEMRMNHFEHHLNAIDVNYGFLDFSITSTTTGTITPLAHVDLSGLEDFLSISLGKSAQSIRDNTGRTIRHFEGFSGVHSVDIVFTDGSKLQLELMRPPEVSKAFDAKAVRIQSLDASNRKNEPRLGKDPISEVWFSLLSAWLNVPLSFLMANIVHIYKFIAMERRPKVKSY